MMIEKKQSHQYPW